MKICVVGSGYVGLVSGTCFADLGNDVICVDIDQNRVDMLNSGKVPIFEPGLDHLFLKNKDEGRLRFSSDIAEGIRHGEAIFIGVGTPEGEDHRADLSAVRAVAKSIGEHINGYKVVVNKSTVPVGTGDMVRQIVQENMKEQHEFDVVSNPEFLREGSAVYDFKNPDRVIVGTDSERAKEVMERLYKSVTRTTQPLMFTDIKSAEIIKYASNSMLATRISFMNMLACLCEKEGADITQVSKGMGLDRRIGPKFLHAGIGYGGSCFPKDVQALTMTLEDKGCDAALMRAVTGVNKAQRDRVTPTVREALGGLQDKKVAVWGIAFKPKTDDIREAPAIDIIRAIEADGGKVNAYDPEAQTNAKRHLPNVDFFETPYDALAGVDALIICTEWDDFRNLDIHRMKSLMNQPVLYDGRNIYSKKEMKEAGFTYFSIGRGGQ
ncbi:UDP-glucose/GDP-mannose dehydrogenase family protein [Candidatus Woesearchaeota archaeon]|nr:UDP-glucose/GDP-mannose dehydrogenase family protein [Candidatus Woesearchaeota archaeon]